jgi:hypothetical protein
LMYDSSNIFHHLNDALRDVRADLEVVPATYRVTLTQSYSHCH